MNRKLFIALEQEQMIDRAIEVINRPASIPDAAESPETAMLEVQEHSFEGEEQIEQVEEAIEVSDALDEYKRVLVDVEGQGGLSTESLQILNIGLKHCYKRVGLESTTIALESYSSNKVTTKVALESIAEKSKTLLKAIVDAIKRGIQWIVDFFKDIFVSTKRMQKRAQELLALSKTTDITDTKQELTNTHHIYNKLSMAGKVDVVYSTDVTKKLVSKTLLPMYTDVTKIVASLGKSITDQDEANKYGETISAVINNMRSISKLTFNGNVLPGELSFKIDADGINSALDKAMEIDLRGSATRDPLRAKLTTFTSLVGEAVTAAKDSINFTATNSDNLDKKLPVLSNHDIQMSLANVESILTEVKQFETESKKLERECNQILLKSNIANFISKLDVMDLHQHLRSEILKITSRFLSLGNYISSKTLTFGLNVSKATMDYCELSLKKVSGEKMSSGTSLVTV